MEEPERKAALCTTACNGTKFAKLMWVVTAKAKMVKARKTGQIEEKLDCIISFLCMQMQMMLHNIG